MELDRVIIIPSHVPPHKAAPDLASDEQRLAMCEATFTDKRFLVSDMEMRRGGLSYTVDTLAYLQEEVGGELFFLIGDDMLFYFDKWRDPHGVLRRCRIVTSVRSEDVKLEELEAYARRHFPDEYEAGRFVFLPMTPFPVSSTEIRNKVRDGERVDGLVSPGTRELIRKGALYL